MQKQYGRVFRRIREQKGLALSYFEKVGIQKSSLSKFERGDTMISFERLNLLLKAMNMSLGEFEIFINHFTPPDQETFLNHFERAVLFQDQAALQSLYQETQGMANYQLRLLTKSKCQSLSPFEIQRLLEALYINEHWGYLELCLVETLLDYLQTTALHTFIDQIQERFQNYDLLYVYRRKIHQIAYHAVLILAAEGDQKRSKQILRLTKPQDQEQNLDQELDFYLRMLRQLAIAFTQLCEKPTSKAQKSLEAALILMEQLGSPQLRAYYSHKITQLQETSELKSVL